MFGLTRCAVTIVACSRCSASEKSSCASITHTSAQQPPNVTSGFTAADAVSTWPGKSHTSNCTKEELAMSFFTILFVDSRKSVSCGDILWKTTFWIEDFPARRAPMRRTRGFAGGTGVDVDVDAFGGDDDSRPLDMVGVARRLAAVGRNSRCGCGGGGGGGGGERRQEFSLTPLLVGARGGECRAHGAQTPGA